MSLYIWGSHFFIIGLQVHYLSYMRVNLGQFHYSESEIFCSQLHLAFCGHGSERYSS